MKKNFRVSLIYTVTTLIMSVVGAWFGNILLERYIDENVGLFISGSNQPIIYSMYMILCILFFLTSAFLFKSRKLPDELYERNGVLAGASFVAGLLLIFSAVLFFVSANFGLERVGNELMTFRVKTICSVLAIPAGLYFLFVTFSSKPKSKLLAVFSLFPILWTVAYLMSIYFDHSTLINSPAKIIHQMALIFFVMFQLQESRYTMNRQKPKVFFFMTLSSLFMIASWTLPQVYRIGTGETKFTSDVTYVFIELVMLFYCIGRAFGFALDCKYSGEAENADIPKTDPETEFEEDTVDSEENEYVEADNEPVVEPIGESLKFENTPNKIEVYDYNEDEEKEEEKPEELFVFHQKTNYGENETNDEIKPEITDIEQSDVSEKQTEDESDNHSANEEKYSEKDILLYFSDKTQKSQPKEENPYVESNLPDQIEIEYVERESQTAVEQKGEQEETKDEPIREYDREPMPEEKSISEETSESESVHEQTSEPVIKSEPASVDIAVSKQEIPTEPNPEQKLDDDKEGEDSSEEEAPIRIKKSPITIPGKDIPDDQLPSPLRARKFRVRDDYGKTIRPKRDISFTDKQNKQ